MRLSWTDNKKAAFSMTILLILLILIALGIYAVKEYYEIRLNVRPLAVPRATLDALTNLMVPPVDQIDQGGRFLQIGSGYGGLILGMAKRLTAWQIDGLEQNPSLWLLSNMRSVGRNTNNYRFFIGDYVTTPLRGYDIIFIHQTAKVLARWETSLARRLPPGPIMVTLNKPLPRLKPINVINFEGDNKFYVYQKRPTAPSTAQTGAYVIDQAPPVMIPAAIPSTVTEPELPLDIPPQPLVDPVVTPVATTSPIQTTLDLSDPETIDPTPPLPPPPPESPAS